ncbi:MAG: sensor histidine kinase, partial [Chloroflexota bacterium]|nr:sensor histidine kinase [Chloroflexota bacterium]
GCGMTQEELEHAFDRFYRGPRRSVPGSGLGLAIAKRAVERAKGTLAARSEPGCGTCFSISLPRVAASANAEHRQLGES